MSQGNRHDQICRAAASAAGSWLLALLLAFVWTGLMAGDHVAYPNVLTGPFAPGAPPKRATANDTALRVLTVNIAHGRKYGSSQLFQRAATAEANLDDIAALLQRIEPDVVALQEADGPSSWSGSFDHVAYLANGGMFPFHVRGEHQRGMAISFGTALLSTQPLSEPVAVTFRPSPPTTAKGFVVATVDWPGGSGLQVDVVSVHLDFSRRTVRERQVDDLIRRLAPRGRPLIVMGDFNAGWEPADSPVKTLATALDLSAYQPDDPNQATYPRFGTRIDWILISDELAFRSYRVLPDLVSDHAAVVAEIGLRDTVRATNRSSPPGGH